MSKIIGRADPFNICKRDIFHAQTPMDGQAVTVEDGIMQYITAIADATRKAADLTLGGSDGSSLAATPAPGKVIGPSFAADEIADAIEAIIETYRGQRAANERFIDTVRRIGIEPFKAPANAVRRSTAHAA